MAFRLNRVSTATPEERVATRIKAIVEDLNLDLEQTGVMLARVLPHLTYNRLVSMIEAAIEEKDLIMNPHKRHEKWRQDGLW